jgi:hypothetical protein
MLSRRSFLLASFGTLTLGELTQSYNFALAKKTPRAPVIVGPHSISREDWPPAIMPDHVGITGSGYICFTDDFGRLAIVDLRHAVTDKDKSAIKIVGELNGIGTKVIDFAFGPQSAHGLVYRENENKEPVVYLVSVNFANATSPSIVNQTEINRFTEGTAIAVGNDMLCLSGISASGENIASVYSGAKRSGEATYLASLTMKNPVRRVDIQDRQLVILSSAAGGSSQIDVVDLANPTAPSIRNSVTIGGDCRVMARYKDILVVAGLDDKAGSAHGCQVRAISLNSTKEGATPLNLPDVTAVSSIAASPRGDQYLLLCESGGERAVIAVACDRKGNLQKLQQLKIPSGKGEGNSKGTVVMKENVAYVASGWSGVTVINRSKEGLGLGPTYDIPRLSAAGIASWGDMVVLAGAQLQLYSISKPERPSLINWVDPDTAIKAIVGAGSYVLCLSREEITLRKMDKLREVAATVKAQVSQLCFDNSQKVAFGIKALEKTTRITRLKIYSNSVTADAPFEVPGVFNRCQATNGMLVLSGLNDLALYKTGSGDQSARDLKNTASGGTVKAAMDKAGALTSGPTAASVAISKSAAGMELVGSHHFDNLALRDVAVADDAVIATAVDQNLQGFFVVLAKEDKDLHVLGSINLPSDGVALAVSGSKAIAVGRNLQGKDVASIVTFSSKINPQILSTLSVIDGVSSVAIKDQMAVLGGRGLEIITLS